MMDKRLIVTVVVTLIVVVCATLLVRAMLEPRPAVTKANFERIKRGMTKAEVEAIFGKPNMKSAHDNCSAWGQGDEEVAAVWYDERDRVGLKAWLRGEK